MTTFVLIAVGLLIAQVIVLTLIVSAKIARWIKEG
jgi:hypothetical protein